ncbi:MAG TPA: trypsin-like peptidase domain-containing protein [Candidatus Binatia bacterium]|nr:trypsin-like peptidase domain-containing protein [Candidatus Binatia bacterium]
MPPSGPGTSGWGYPAWGAAPYPPPPPATAYPPLAYRQPRRKRLWPATLAAGVAIALAAGGIGAGIGVALRAPTSAASSPQSGTSLPSESSQPATGGGFNASAITAAVDPSVVDINDVINGAPAAGTGIVISSSGIVLTNNHVIDGATNITAQVNGQGTIYQVKVLGYDNADDIALLQLENAATLKVAPIGDSSTVQVGDSIVAIGNALGRGGTPAAVTGTVTALDQTVTASDGSSSETLNGTIRIQAGIQPGDSGGPLVNAAGQVIGIDTAGSSSGVTFAQQTSGTTGFAIPIDTAMAIAHQIESGRSSGNVVIGSTGPLIGVEVQNAPASPTSPAGAGALIVGVVSGTPAAAAGLQAGDVIVSVSGAAVTNAGDLASALRSDRPGQTIQLGWVDGSGAPHTSSITLAAGPPN